MDIVICSLIVQPMEACHEKNGHKDKRQLILMRAGSETASSIVENEGGGAEAVPSTG